MGRPAFPVYRYNKFLDGDVCSSGETEACLIKLRDSYNFGCTAVGLHGENRIEMPVIGWSKFWKRFERVLAFQVKATWSAHVCKYGKDSINFGRCDLW